MKGVNNGQIIATVIRSETRKTTINVTDITVAGMLPITTDEGETKEISFYQSVIFFNKLAEFSERLKIGQAIWVVGELRNNTWENAEHNKNGRIDVIAKEFTEIDGEVETIADSNGNPRLKSAMNNFALAGNLTRDAELRYTPQGTPILTGDVAVNSSYYKNNGWVETVDFFPFTFFGDKAQNLIDGAKRGSAISGIGIPKRDSWDDGKRSKGLINFSELNVLTHGSKQK